MKNFIRLAEMQPCDLERIFAIADKAKEGKYRNIWKEKTVLLFFPESGLRTRVTFEKGIVQLGGNPVRFSSETLDKKEDLKDVCGYLNNWADLVVVRHKEIRVLEKMAEYLSVPLINAMTDCSHPCEILSDLYALSKLRRDFRRDQYLFCGASGNIGLTWKEAAQVMGFALSQCCAKGYEMDGVRHYYRIEEAAAGKDIICTDSLPPAALKDFKECQVTRAAMELANEGALLNPCPPFYRGEEVTAEAIDSKYFVGYEFKKNLLWVQQAVMLYCLEDFIA